MELSVRHLRFTHLNSKGIGQQQLFGYSIYSTCSLFHRLRLSIPHFLLLLVNILRSKHPQYAGVSAETESALLLINYSGLLGDKASIILHDPFNP